MIGKPTQHSEVAKGSPERFGYSWERYPSCYPRMRRSSCAGRHSRKNFGGSAVCRWWVWNRAERVLAHDIWREGGLAVDVDDRTLNRARSNLERYPNLEVRKQSIYDIEEENTFDIAFSIGVVHHLSDPDAAVARLVRAVKPGGQVLLWLYGRENNGWIVHFFNPLRSRLFSWLPLPLVHILSWPLTALLWLAVRLGFQPTSTTGLSGRFRSLTCERSCSIT